MDAAELEKEVRCLTCLPGNSQVFTDRCREVFTLAYRREEISGDRRNAKHLSTRTVEQPM